MKSRGLVFPRCWIALAISTATAAAAADWPMWRGDAGRTGATNAAIPADLKLQWTLELPPLTPAWHDPRLQFDAGYQPIVVGKRLLVASSRNDSVSAYDTESGKRLWRFFAGGPIRFAPVAHDRKLYFGADDGCVYCLDLSTGSQLWRFNAALSDRRVLGNERLISVWPVRGGPVIHDGKLFFTVGIWPFEGTLLYTLDAERGEVLRADNVIAKVAMPTGGLATVQDRCPQGYLAVSGDRLYVPCGRSNVCCFDLRTGVPVPLQYNGSKQADYHVVASGKWMIQGDTIVDVDARHVLPLPAFRPAIAGDDVYFAQSNEVFGLDIARQQTIELDRGGKKVRARVPTVLCRFRDMPVEQIDLKADALPKS